MGIRTNYINPITKESIWCKREEQPEGWIQISHLKKVDELKARINKEDLFDYYIVQNNDFHKTAIYFEINPEQVLHDLLKYYGIKKSAKLARKNNTYKRSHNEAIEIGKKSAKTQKNNWANKSDAEKIVWSEKQKIAHNTDNFKQKISQINKDYRLNLDEETKQKRNTQRSATEKKTWAENKELLLEQRAITAKLNREKRKSLGLQYCRSNLEQKIYNCLIEKYPDLKYDQKIDDRYPFFVDFYISSLDLFIEINGHPSHGNWPYNKNSPEAIEESYRLRESWLETYTEKDPEKVKKAKENNLNYIMLYPNNTLEANYIINENKNKDIIKLMFENSK